MVGLGTGTTVAHPAAGAGRARPDDSLRRDVAARPSDRPRRSACPSSRSRTLDRLDIAIDGADQIAPDGWLVKGGGAAHTREKIVAAAADRFVVIADSTKPVDALRAADPARAAGFGLAGDAARSSATRALRDVPREPRRRRDRRLPGDGRRSGPARGAARRPRRAWSSTACSRPSSWRTSSSRRGDDVERTLSLGRSSRAPRRSSARMHECAPRRGPRGSTGRRRSSLRERLALVGAGDQPEDLARARERRDR